VTISLAWVYSLSMIFFREPVPTFRDHALGCRCVPVLAGAARRVRTAPPRHIRCNGPRIVDAGI
jgi:hypothetical protein